jgi:hypothetical protein
MTDNEITHDAADGHNDESAQDHSPTRTCPMCGHTPGLDDRECSNCGESLEFPELPAVDKPSFVLHPVRGVVWAAVLGGPLAAGIVLAINYARMRRRTAAWWVGIMGVAATLVFFAAGFVAPDVPNSIFLLVQLVGVYMLANALQGNRIRSHSRQRGEIASAWQAVGIGAVCGVVLLVLIFGVVYALEASPGTVVRFGDDEIYYLGDATEEDARKLGEFLKEAGFFRGEGVTVTLEITSGRYTVSFVLVDGAWNEPDTVATFRELAQGLPASVCPRPLTVQLCDDHLVPHKTFVIR